MLDLPLFLAQTLVSCTARKGNLRDRRLETPLDLADFGYFLADLQIDWNSFTHTLTAAHCVNPPFARDERSWFHMLLHLSLVLLNLFTPVKARSAGLLVASVLTCLLRRPDNIDGPHNSRNIGLPGQRHLTFSVARASRASPLK